MAEINVEGLLKSCANILHKYYENSLYTLGPYAELDTQIGTVCGNYLRHKQENLHATRLTAVNCLKKLREDIRSNKELPEKQKIIWLKGLSLLIMLSIDQEYNPNGGDYGCNRSVLRFNIMNNILKVVDVYKGMDEHIVFSDYGHMNYLDKFTQWYWINSVIKLYEETLSKKTSNPKEVNIYSTFFESKIQKPFLQNWTHGRIKVIAFAKVLLAELSKDPEKGIHETILKRLELINATSNLLNQSMEKMTVLCEEIATKGWPSPEKINNLSPLDKFFFLKIEKLLKERMINPADENFAKEFKVLMKNIVAWQLLGVNFFINNSLASEIKKEEVSPPIDDIKRLRMKYFVKPSYQALNEEKKLSLELSIVEKNKYLTSACGSCNAHLGSLDQQEQLEALDEFINLLPNISGKLDFSKLHWENINLLSASLTRLRGDLEIKTTLAPC